MNIKKQRLLTPGPTPLYPKALQAMLGADIHHRTKDFRALYTSVLADLKVVLGTAHDVLILASSGTSDLPSTRPASRIRRIQSGTLCSSRSITSRALWALKPFPPEVTGDCPA